MSSLAEKSILDACCGGRMCWFNKAHPDALYVDKRRAPAGHIPLRPNHAVEPDEIADFRSLPYPDASFSLVLFDPPHICETGKRGKGVIGAKFGLLPRPPGTTEAQYGMLQKDGWQEYIRDGFVECMRVLKPSGVLVFKWSERELKLKDVLGALPQEPLFGHRTTNNGTFWLCFMKLSEKGISHKEDK